MESPTRCSWCAANDLCNGVTGKFLHVAQDNDGFVLGGKTIENTLDPLAQLFVADIGIRPSAHSGGVARELIDTECAVLAAATQPIDREIDDDAIEPRVEVEAEVKALDISMDSKKCFLSDILGILGRAHKVVGDPIDARLVAIDQLLKRPDVIGLDANEESALGLDLFRRPKGASVLVVCEGSCLTVEPAVFGCHFGHGSPSLSLISTGDTTEWHRLPQRKRRANAMGEIPIILKLFLDNDLCPNCEVALYSFPIHHVPFP